MRDWIETITIILVMWIITFVAICGTIMYILCMTNVGNHISQTLSNIIGYTVVIGSFIGSIYIVRWAIKEEMKDSD